jgi:hypothetical protein
LVQQRHRLVRIGRSDTTRRSATRLEALGIDAGRVDGQ